MSIRAAIHHRTRYAYDRPVSIAPHIIRLKPAPHCRTPIVSYALQIEPKPHFINWQQDPFGNFLARVVFPEPARELVIDVEVIADMVVVNPFDFFVEAYAEQFPFAYPPQLAKELAPYFELQEPGPLLTEYLAGISREPQAIVSFLVGLNCALNQHIAYTIRMEPGVQTCEETLSLRSGSCRDSGWLLVQILRRLGLAARFVSGYLVQLKPDVEALDGPSGAGEDFTDLHAWAEVYIPGAGWLGLDPTSGLFAGEGHIPLAATPDPVSAAPITGATEPCQVEFFYQNDVTRFRELPRVTKPFTDAQWNAIQALGRHVDADMQAHDLALTMGGEPTFVSIDDMESEQWNTAADGDEKRLRAIDLLGRLADAFAPGGLRYYGQGKWYPGEALPRWRYGCFWRADGEPLWSDPALLAHPAAANGYGVKHAKTFIKTLAQLLGVNSHHLHAAYEDLFYYLWKEGTLPVNIDPLKANLKSSFERRQLARLLDQDPGQPIGYVLPLTWGVHHRGWFSSPWMFRRGRLYLLPGDSPMGYRLPLDSLPWMPPEQKEPLPETNLWETPPPLPPRDQLDAPADDRMVSDIAYTALCVQPREGHLHIFMPPLGKLEHYASLIKAVEDAARSCHYKVVIEGYEPPSDHRLRKLFVTPDPGVIEVNIHPSHDWDELCAITTRLYEEARLARLATEKFMLDGRHTGTGGGNHMTLGGATPEASPFLRRPSLLRSLITYWQHHPALSYLFSSAFVGPTSQAPRVDEGRSEFVYELEIALSLIPDGDVAQPWLIDRVLRHLLVDLTGNTHRAEFCIDKLYSPDSATGRLGLVELRGFEMPPHARMALLQALLVRALCAWFWKQPYKKPLIRWGTELHDRFLLPHFVWKDLLEILADLRTAGYEFDPNWFLPFNEFRFPRYGEINLDGIELELRAAIEPWHVLGEEAASGGTARYVDSSMERLQVRLRGITADRHILACNGRRVNLRPTGVHGEQVAGIRYRAWQPWSCLHPTIGVHSPLVFDVIDTWTGRSLGGCSYHVSHYGGRNYSTFPVNALEAEARRISRFTDDVHTPGAFTIAPESKRQARFMPKAVGLEPVVAPPEEENEEFPYTFDLRRPAK
ncbi:MAG TPA: transglutaminase family protein [Kiritimatiellia bacterium]|nr:transglutaminase family protein [Kiritimatiellia bacterium]HMO97724.1 transglutaminase family protein [Kiritimatiellia bacterium]HMP95363.1 transglutaminase family protein [Kiritimatiellia bacterium]